MDRSVSGMPSDLSLALPVYRSGEAEGYLSEVAALLHARLRTAAILLLTAALANVGYAHFEIVRAYAVVPGELLGGYGFFVVCGILLYALWRNSRLSMTQLRWIEILLFSMAALSLLWSQVRMLRSNWLNDLLAGPSRYKVLLLAGDHLVLPWVFLVIVYGVFIPNTWQRSLRMVVLLGGFPLVCGLLWWLLAGRSRLDIPLQVFFVTLTELGLVGLVSVLGSKKIHELRQQAYRARQLGQYRLIRLLGAGGMGEVYLAEHQLLRRECAVKVIRPTQASDSLILQRFEREVRAMASLTHPNTVEVYDYGRAEDGTFYYAMEYIPGFSLEQLATRDGVLPAGRVVYLLRQVCGALAEAHSKGLIHRDIKPSNILVCCRGGVPDVVKLLDFGLVRPIGGGDRSPELTMEGTLAGTPAFLSPEQAACRTNLDGRSDLYSLGAVAYYLLTGRAVFLKDSVFEVVAAHQYEQPRSLAQVRPGIPPDLEAVVLRCLEKRPDQRFPTAESLDQALAGCASSADWGPNEAAAWWHTHSDANTATPAQMATTLLMRDRVHSRSEPS